MGKGRYTVCDKCNRSVVDWSIITYDELSSRYKYQKHSRIRGLSRLTAIKHFTDLKCKNCGYDKHVEVCHIKAINNFSGNTPITVINDISNLIILCPNCHWELDNNILILE